MLTINHLRGILWTLIENHTAVLTERRLHIMTNSALFREAVEKAGIKYKFLAESLGLTPYGLQKKIQNQSEFKASEIYVASKVLNLTEADRNAIFFYTMR